MGNTKLKQSRRLKKWDHPHLRGEYSEGKEEKHENMGSPPLAWGIRQLQDVYYSAFGITPTCVGNTLVKSKSMLTIEDHPHLRGEYLPIRSTWTLR